MIRGPEEFLESPASPDLQFPDSVSPTATGEVQELSPEHPSFQPQGSVLGEGDKDVGEELGC